MAAVACLCLAGPLALPAQAQTTNFYLWRTTMTVGESSGTLGYDKSDSLGSNQHRRGSSTTRPGPRPTNITSTPTINTVEALYITDADRQKLLLRLIVTFPKPFEFAWEPHAYGSTQHGLPVARQWCW